MKKVYKFFHERKKLKISVFDLSNKMETDGAITVKEDSHSAVVVVYDGLRITFC